MKHRFYRIRKRLLFAVLALLMVVTMLPLQAFAADNVRDMADLPDGVIHIDSSNLSDWDGKVLTGTNRSANQYLQVSGVTLNLTIRDLVINRANDNIGYFSAIEVLNGATLNLTLEGTSTLTGYEGGAGIHVPSGSTLTITENSTGTLNANGGNSRGGAAGIGAIAGNVLFGTSTPPTVRDVGKIVIAGGTVNAKGGTYRFNYADQNGAAGIGGSYGASGAVIEITGGTVNATGGAAAAGIGGGTNGSVASVTVSGGTVTATKGTMKNMSGQVVYNRDAAAIGNGYSNVCRLKALCRAAI